MWGLVYSVENGQGFFLQLEDTQQSLGTLWKLHKAAEGSFFAAVNYRLYELESSSYSSGYILSSQPTDGGCQFHSSSVLCF